jgi:hypothetical protein
MLIRSLSAVLFIVCAAGCIFGQALPKAIRGYKLYDPRAVRSVSNGNPSPTGPKVMIESLTFDSIGLTGISLSATAVLTDVAVSGAVDFITFRDIRVNGMPVGIVEYRQGFKVTDGGRTALPVPLELLVPIRTVAKAANNELIEARSKWSVTGTALVFGRFRRFGFTFKRVVPVHIDIRIDNPLPRI